LNEIRADQFAHTRPINGRTQHLQFFFSPTCFSTRTWNRKRRKGGGFEWDPSHLRCEDLSVGCTSCSHIQSSFHTRAQLIKERKLWWWGGGGVYFFILESKFDRR
jgi:hypothetical protein